MIDAGLDNAREALEGLVALLIGADVSPQQVKLIEAGGYTKKPHTAIVDLTGEDSARARRLVEVADAVCVPVRLPQTAARFAAGDTDLEQIPRRHGHAATRAGRRRSDSSSSPTTTTSAAPNTGSMSTPTVSMTMPPKTPANAAPR